jgi:peptide/nickel transport system substrate-binding protein
MRARYVAKGLRSRRWRRVASAVAIGALVAGCSSGPGSSSGGNTGTSSKKSSGGATLVVGITGPVNSLIPVGLQQTDMTYDRTIYEPLVLDGPKGSILPNIVSAWGVSGGGKTLTLHLHSGVTFTNGKPFNASVAVSDLKWGAKPANAEDVEPALAGCTFSAPNATTVVIKMPTAEEVSLLNGLVTLPMVDLSSKLATDPIGTGPFEVSSFTPNVQITAKRYSGYWNKAAAPKVETIDYKVFESATSEVAALQSGAIDVLTYPPLNQVQRLKSGGYRIISSPGTGNFVLMGNVTAKGSPFDNEKVREALSDAFDRPLFTKLQLSGLGKPTCDMWASTSPAFVQNLPGCVFDLKKAKHLLASGGYPHGFKITVDTMETKWPEVTAFLPIYKTDLAKIGVNLNINVESPTSYSNTFLEIWHKGLPDIAPQFFGWGNVDPFFVADYPFYGLSNISGFQSAQYDGLIHKALAAGSSAKALALYKQIAIVAEQESFDMALATRPYVYVLNKKVQGSSVDSDGIADWASASLG